MLVPLVKVIVTVLIGAEAVAAEVLLLLLVVIVARLEAADV